MAQVIPLGPAARMLTTREAALRLGVSLRTVQLWVEGQILPAARTPGGHRRIPYNAVEALAMSMGLTTMAGQPEVPEPEPVQAGDVGRIHPTRVMVVGAEPVWVASVGMALEVFGPSIEVETADNGYLALLRIGRQTPHLLVVTLELSGLDGVQMLETLRRCDNLSGMRVLALSTRPIRLNNLPSNVDLLTQSVLPTPEVLAIKVGRWLLQHRSSRGVRHE